MVRRKKTSKNQAKHAPGNRTDRAAQSRLGGVSSRSPGLHSDEQRTIETRVAEAMTIGWMLSMMATIVCLTIYAVVLVLMVATDRSEELAVYAELLLFTSLVIGVISLILVPIVYRLRRQKPPRGVTRFAVSVGLLPVLVMMVRAMMR